MSGVKIELEYAKTRKKIVTSSCLDGNTTEKEIIDLTKIVDDRTKLEVDECTNLGKKTGGKHKNRV